MKLLPLKFGLFVLIAAAVISCKKTTDIGSGLLPGSDYVGAIYTDTFSLITNTVRDDSVLSSSTLNNLAGFVYDPAFGKTYASFFTQLFLPTNDVNFGDPDTLYIDSVVLTLAYNGFYGYQNVPQTFNVYRVTEDMGPKPTTGYYSNKSFAVDPSPIGRKELLVPNFADSLNILGVVYPANLRIRLSDRFGQELLDQSGTTNFHTDTTFKQYLKGICLAPDTLATPYAASILYFNLTSVVSGLHLYWHTPNHDSLTYVLPVGVNEIRTNFFKHNYANTAIPQHLQASSTDNDSVVYVQGAGGLKTRINIPALSSLQNVLINKAEIVMTEQIDPAKTDSIFLSPARLVCATADSMGKDTLIPDALLTFPSAGGAKISKVTLDRQTYAQYTFSVASQVQKIVEGTTVDRGLYIIAYKRGETADRIKAMGNNRDDNLKMKLNLIYTPIH
ncbi:MAG: DUF4270 domain-containing protein [Chitinophagales bacterium]